MAPTQLERTESTTMALAEAARELFAEEGYAATSLDAVVAQAGVTKGALYHHFKSKRDLFAAVFAAEQVRLTGAIVAAYQRRKDPLEALEAGAGAFIEACQDPGAQRIFLIDSPSALGWETIRRLESGSLLMIERGIQRAIDAGRIESRPVEPLAHMLYGALSESAMVVASATDPDEALESTLAELHRLLGSLAV